MPLLRCFHPGMLLRPMPWQIGGCASPLQAQIAPMQRPSGERPSGKALMYMVGNTMQGSRQGWGNDLAWAHKPREARAQRPHEQGCVADDAGCRGPSNPGAHDAWAFFPQTHVYAARPDCKTAVGQPARSTYPHQVALGGGADETTLCQERGSAFPHHKMHGGRLHA